MPVPARNIRTSERCSKRMKAAAGIPERGRLQRRFSLPLSDPPGVLKWIYRNKADPGPVPYRRMGVCPGYEHRLGLTGCHKQYISGAGGACCIICMYFAHSPVYRTGGDEFTVLLRGRDFEDRQRIMEMFRMESEAHISPKDVVVSVRCSDYRPGEDGSIRDVYRRADGNMFENKKHLKSMGAAARL